MFSMYWLLSRHALHTLKRANRGSRRQIDPDLRRRLSLEFEPEIRRLARVIGRDLSHWMAATPTDATDPRR